MQVISRWPFFLKRRRWTKLYLITSCFLRQEILRIIRKILVETGTSTDPEPDIELIAVLGDEPAGGTLEQKRRTLSAIGARWITYGSLFKNTAAAYGEYVDAHSRAAQLIEVIESIRPPSKATD